MSILRRLAKLENRAPKSVVIEVRTLSGEVKRVTAAEYEADPSTILVRIVSGTSFSDLRRLVAGNKKRAELIAAGKYAGKVNGGRFGNSEGGIN